MEPVPISKNGYELKIGDKVKIVGKSSVSSRLVNVTTTMQGMLNTPDEYEVKKIKPSMKESRTALVYVAGWWWLGGNLFKTNIKDVKPQIKNVKESMFDINQLVT